MSLTRLIEDEINTGLKEGNQHMFSLLFKMYYSPLCVYSVSILKNNLLAEEIVQEVFIRLWENRENINIETSFKAYLYRSVHNHCLNSLKSRLIQKKHTELIYKEINYHAELATLNFNEGLLDNLVSVEMELFFEKAIDALPEQCKEIFRLSRFEQLTYPQIADKLQISVNTVKTQISRALEKLHEAYRNF